MSSRGFLLRIHDDDSFDQPEMRPLSPNIIISRSEYFAAREEGEKWTNHQFSSINVVIIRNPRFYRLKRQ